MAAKLVIPSRRLARCDHAEVEVRRNKGKCKRCGQDVYLTVVQESWMTVVEQQEFRRLKKGIVSV